VSLKEGAAKTGAIAQLGEHLLCKQGVVGSIPTGSSERVVKDRRKKKEERRKKRRKSEGG
jgi:hypothetical protein